MNSRRVVIVGGGAAGLSAAYTLKKRGFTPMLLEADEQVGGRMGGERVNGFSTDKGADFFPESYDVTFELCEELGLPLTRVRMDIGWYRHGRWVVTTPLVSLKSVIRNIMPFRTLEFLSLRGIWPTLKLARSIRGDASYLNYASDHRIAELDGAEAETYGEYLDRLGIPDRLRVTLEGFLKLTMGDVEQFGATWIRAFLGEVLLKNDRLFAPEEGCSALARALAEECGDGIRVSTPVKRVIIEDGSATGVVTDDGRIEADAVICAVPAPKAVDIIPDLPPMIREALGAVRYSRGVRVVVGLDHRPLPPGWSAVLYPEDDTPSLLDRSTYLPRCAPPGKSMLDLWVGEDRAEDLFPLDDEEITRQLLADARRRSPPESTIPQEDEVLFSRVYRWNEAVCKGQPGMFQAILEMRGQLNKHVANLFFAGDYMRSPIVNGAVASGISAADEAATLLALDSGSDAP